jgi:hypothetical protein
MNGTTTYSTTRRVEGMSMWRRRRRVNTGAAATVRMPSASASARVVVDRDEEDLQPNIDGLSRDEVLLSCVLTTALVVLVMRYLAHRAGDPKSPRARHVIGRH